MRSDFGPVRVLTPRAAHAVAAELKSHQLFVESIPLPAMVLTETPMARTVASLPPWLLVQRPRRRR